MGSFNRLIRFLAKNGKTYFGDAILPPGATDVSQATEAHIITGDIFGTHQVTDQTAEIRLLLAPLAPEQARTVRCLGLNYAAHAKEAGLKLPQYPVLFHKPLTSLTGPYDPIPIPPIAQTPAGLDYECEMVVIISKPGRDIPESNALNHILGFAIGNDVSHREWQLQHGSGQWCHGKSFDGWAPFGPAIVSQRIVGDPQALKIWTKVNGETVQESSTADMIFDVKQLVAFLSRGVTLLPGDVIFTGTPAGVAMGRKPQNWLKNGDVVEVGLDKVGTCVNKVEWQPEKAKI